MKGAHMRKLSNPCESLDNVIQDQNYREHRVRIGQIVAPNNKWSLAGLRKAVNGR